MKQLEFDFEGSTYTVADDYKSYTIKWPIATKLSEIMPSYSMTFFNLDHEVGKLDWTGPAMTFSGNFTESANTFFESITTTWQARLNQEYKQGYNQGYQDGQKENSL
jgi:hypothetical protein